jgi:chemotaxis protein CheC
MANVGVGHATTALSEMTGRRFTMSVPRVDSLPVERLAGYLGGPEKLCVAAFMAFHGDVSGNMAFLFPWESADRLWRTLIGTSPADATDLSELEASAMLEVGNVLNSSFLNALSGMSGLSLQATPPLLSVEMARAIVQSIVVEAELTNAIALAIDTEIFEHRGNLLGTFFCIPAHEGLAALLRGLGLQEAA